MLDIVNPLFAGDDGNNVPRMVLGFDLIWKASAEYSGLCETTERGIKDEFLSRLATAESSGLYDYLAYYCGQLPSLPHGLLHQLPW